AERPEVIAAHQLDGCARLFQAAAPLDFKCAVEAAARGQAAAHRGALDPLQPSEPFEQATVECISLIGSGIARRGQRNASDEDVLRSESEVRVAVRRKTAEHQSGADQ